MLYPRRKDQEELLEVIRSALFEELGEEDITDAAQMLAEGIALGTIIEDLLFANVARLREMYKQLPMGELANVKEFNPSEVVNLEDRILKLAERYRLTVYPSDDILRRMNRPKLYPKQAEALRDTRPYVLTLASRQSGKTHGAADLAAATMAAGIPVLYATASTNQTQSFQDSVDEIIAPLLADDTIIKRGDSQLYRFRDPSMKGRIYFRTAKTPDRLRGVRAGLVILDEYQHMHPETLDIAQFSTLTFPNSSIRHFMTVPDGTKIVQGVDPMHSILTAEKYRDQAAEGSELYGYHEMRATDNPHADRKQLENIRATTPEAIWKREFECDLAEATRGVIKAERIRHVTLDEEGWRITGFHRHWDLGYTTDPENAKSASVALVTYQHVTETSKRRYVLTSMVSGRWDMHDLEKRIDEMANRDLLVFGQKCFNQGVRMVLTFPNDSGGAWARTFIYNCKSLSNFSVYRILETTEKRERGYEMALASEKGKLAYCPVTETEEALAEDRNFIADMCHWPYVRDGDDCAIAAFNAYNVATGVEKTRDL